ncbi:hypothetical protein HDR58_07170 [bacterium]|nr:hypothetical protein [bacterium]
MAFNTDNFLVIGGGNPYRPNDYFVHERENNDGKPGKIVTMADGRGDLKEVAQSYIEEGFDPSKIIINGQLASDVFELESKKDDKMPKQPKANTTFSEKLAVLLALGRARSHSANQIAQEQVLQDNLRFQDLVNQQNHLQFIDQTNLINQQNTLQMHGMM